MIVETGAIVPDADSYASVEDADAYAEARGYSAWLALSDEAKEAALVKATDYIEQLYGARWLGYVMSSQQPLSWPRQRVPMRGTASDIPANVVPLGVKKATFELALRAGTGTELMPDLGREVVREKVDVVEVEYRPSGRQAPSFTVATLLLEPFIRSAGNGVLKLERA